MKKKIQGKRTSINFGFYGKGVSEKDIDNMFKFYIDASYEDLLGEKTSNELWEDHLVQKIVAEKQEENENRILLKIAVID